MSRTNKFSALQFIQGKLVAVEIAHRDNEFELTSIIEGKASVDYIEALRTLPDVPSELKEILVKDIGSIRKAGEIDAPNISFCLNSRWVFIHTFPQDETLPEPERKSHLAWELSNYLAPSKYEDYVTGVAKLDDLPTLGTSYVLSASARRGLISLLRQVTSQLNLRLVVVDVDHFGAEHALEWNYPETANETVALLAVGGYRVEASVLRNGQSVQYRWGELKDTVLSPDVILHILPQNTNGRDAPRKLYVYGNYEEPVSRSNFTSIEFPEKNILNPVRGLELSHRLRRRDLSNLHQYAPAIGLAMREG